MTPTRRDVLRGLAGGVVAGASGLARPGGARAATTLGPVPRFDGELRVDDTSRAAAADDFGHVVHRRPRAVLLPGSVRDVATAVTWATRRGWQVAPQGQGHSVYGRAQTHDGLVVDMSQLRTIHGVEADRVVVDAGATWGEVLAATLPHGLTPPVLTDYLELSVGGTVVVGGVGATTSRHGVQSDQVVELDVVTGAGEQVTCSPSRHADLFDAVRAGLGQVAVITRATLALVPAPTQVRRFLLVYRDLAALLHDARLLDTDGRFESVQGAVLPTPQGWRFRLDAVAPFTGDDPPDDGALLAGLADERGAAEITSLPYAGYADRLAAFEALLRSNGQWFHPHPWLTTFVGDATVDGVVGRELAALTPADVGAFGQVVLSPLHRAAVASPLLRMPDDDRCWAFNLVRVPTTADPAEARRMVADNRATYERVIAAGGALYPVSAFPMSRQDWRRHFGPAWPALRRAKRRYDPANVLTPGYELF